MATPGSVELDERATILADLLLEGGLREGKHLVAVGGGWVERRSGEQEEDGKEGFAVDLRVQSTVLLTRRQAPGKYRVHFFFLRER